MTTLDARPSPLSAELAQGLRRSGALSLPPACYHDPAVAEFEADVIFRRGWVGVGRRDRWLARGDFSAVEVGGVAVLIALDDQGELRAFSNTCRHRGSQLVEGDGNCSRIRCPFHAWTYALDGRLVGAASMAETPNFDKADYPLHEFALGEHDGFVFVCLASDPPPFGDWVGTFSQVHESWPLADLVTVRRREFSVECNWKAFAEVFNEYYHLPYVHSSSIDGLYGEPDDTDDVSGAFTTQFGVTAGTAGLLQDDQRQALPAMPGLSGRDATGVRYSWLYPNIVTAIGVDAMWMYEIYPSGPDRCDCAQVVCFPQSTIDSAGFSDKATTYLERMDVAINEDIPVLERQHRGLRSPFAAQGPFSHLEPSVANFARWYAEQLLGTG